MTNCEALKQLYVALGGSAEEVADVVTTADMIISISVLVENRNVLTEESGGSEG